MKLHAAFVFFIALICDTPLGLATSTLSEAAFKADWQNLFYPDKDGAPRADGEAFFLGQDRDVLQEMQLSVRRINSEALPPREDSFVCQFPLRAKRLAKLLGTPRLLEAARYVDDVSVCPGLRGWQNRVASKSASLVFSSYYLGNPSSTFGHTFLRLNRDEIPKGKDLLDQGVNFGANATSDNPVVYAVGGIFGYFPSSFIALPYYYKVREYNDYEARDLWEYHLELTVSEVQDLILALWEQKDNIYDYYFLTENCGYYMLALVEAAAPRYDLTRGLRKWVIPADTLVVAREAGLIRSTGYRPSLRTQLEYRLRLLDEEDMIVYRRSVEAIKDLSVKDLNQAESEVSTLAVFESPEKERQGRIVDALMDEFDILNKEIYFEDQRAAPSSAALIKRALLFRRAELPVSEPLQIRMPEENDPSMTHGSFRWGAGLFHSRYSEAPSLAGLLIPVRMAYHDFLDPKQGAPEGAQVKVFNFEFSVFQRDQDWKLELETFEPFHLMSVPYFKSGQWDPAWEVRVGAERVTDRFSFRDFRPILDIGYGWGPLMLRGSYQYSVNFPQEDFLFKVAPAGLLRKEISKTWWTLLEMAVPLWAGNSRALENPQELYSYRWLQRWHLSLNQSLELGLQGSDQEKKLFFNYYHLQF